MIASENTNAVENRLKKDVDNLKREKKILSEDIEVSDNTLPDNKKVLTCVTLSLLDTISSIERKVLKRRLLKTYV